MRYPVIFLSVALACCLGSLLGPFLPAHAAEPARLTVLTEDAAPHSHMKDGQVVGASTEFVRKVIEKAGFKPEIRMMAWNAVMQNADATQAIVIYPLSRTQERESKFQWIGRLASYKTFLYKLKARSDLHPKSLDDLHELRIALIRRDVREEYLAARGFKPGIDKNIISVTDNKEAMRLLAVGRVDLAPMSQVGLESTCAIEGMDCSVFEAAMPFGLVMDIYVAANKSAPPDMVKRLQAAYDSLVENGTYQRLLGKFVQ